MAAVVGGYPQNIGRLIYQIYIDKDKLPIGAKVLAYKKESTKHIYQIIQSEHSNKQKIHTRDEQKVCYITLFHLFKKRKQKLH